MQYINLEPNRAKGARRPPKRVEELDLQKSHIEIDLSKLRIACKIRYTADEICSWIRQFYRGDLMDIEFLRRLIDVFINSVFVYDEKIVIYYNIKNSRQVSHMEMLESTEQIDHISDPIEQQKNPNPEGFEIESEWWSIGDSNS